MITFFVVVNVVLAKREEIFIWDSYSLKPLPSYYSSIRVSIFYGSWYWIDHSWNTNTQNLLMIFFMIGFDRSPHAISRNGLPNIEIKERPDIGRSLWKNIGCFPILPTSSHIGGFGLRPYAAYKSIYTAKGKNDSFQLFHN